MALKEFIVARDQGYPLDNPAYKQGAVVELDAAGHAAAIGAGYLIPADPDDKRFTEDMARSVAAFRTAKAAQKKADAAQKKAEERETKAAADAAQKRDEEAKRSPPPDTRKEVVAAILAAAVQPTIETDPDGAVVPDTPETGSASHRPRR